MANTPYYTKAETEAKFAAGGKSVSEAFNQVLQFNRNKYSATAISQSAAIAFSLASSGNVDGVVIRHKIMSDGTNPITFGSEFNVFQKPENDIYPSGLQIFYFNYVGGDVDVAIPTYSAASSGGGSTNTSPVTNSDNYSVTENQTLTVNAANGVLANDSDVEGDALTAILVGQATNGTVNLNADGSFTYTPNTDYTGSDSFTYKTNDGTEDGNTATVTITVDESVAATPEYVVWEQFTRAQDLGSGTLDNIPTEPSGNGWENGAFATKALNGEGIVQFTTKDVNADAGAGLGLENSSYTHDREAAFEMDILLLISSDSNQYTIFENGTQVANAPSLTNGQTYKLRVRADNKVEVLFGETVIYTTPNALTLPLTPIGLLHNEKLDSQIINAELISDNLVTSPL